LKEDKTIKKKKALPGGEEQGKLAMPGAVQKEGKNGGNILQLHKLHICIS